MSQHAVAHLKAGVMEGPPPDALAGAPALKVGSELLAEQ
jgi:hypothetical protein